MLLELLQSNTGSNPILNLLLNDYTNYHWVLVMGGAIAVFVLLALTGFFLARFRNAPRSRSRQWTFEKKIYFCFGIVFTLISLMMALIVAANISTVLNPRHGFSLMVDSLQIPRSSHCYVSSLSFVIASRAELIKKTKQLVVAIVSGFRRCENQSAISGRL